jgi:hypothetical protein
MSWKTDTRLSDLDDGTELEIKCKVCQLHRYELATVLKAQERYRQLYLDELEASLRCRVKTCNGLVRLSVTHDGLNQGFVGGLA